MPEHAESLIRGQPRHPPSSPPSQKGQEGEAREEKARESLPLSYTGHTYTPPAATIPHRAGTTNPATLHPPPKSTASAPTPSGSTKPLPTSTTPASCSILECLALTSHSRIRVGPSALRPLALRVARAQTGGLKKKGGEAEPQRGGGKEQTGQGEAERRRREGPNR